MCFWPTLILGVLKGENKLSLKILWTKLEITEDKDCSWRSVRLFPESEKENGEGRAAASPVASGGNVDRPPNLESCSSKNQLDGFRGVCGDSLV